MGVPDRPRNTAGVWSLVCGALAVPGALVLWAGLSAVGADVSAGRPGFVLGVGLMVAGALGSLVLAGTAVVVGSDRVLGAWVLATWLALLVSSAVVVLG